MSLKIDAAKLERSLRDRLAPIYLVCGDDPLLVQESCDLIRAKLRSEGFSERALFHVEPKFDWQEVLFSANSMSLFAEQRILEIRMPGGKPGDDGAKALISYAEAPPDDTVMLLVLPRLDAGSQRSKWFKALDLAGVFVPVWPVDVDQMPRWLGERFRRAGLKVERDAIETMVERVEGNLLAAIQEIERLSLLANGETVTLAHILEGVEDSSRYSVFSLIDAAVGQDAKRTVRVMQGLRAEGADVIHLTAMVAREIRALASMASAVAAGQTIDGAIKSAHVFWKRKAIVKLCLERHRMPLYLRIGQGLSAVDRMAKGLMLGDPWRTLEELLLLLAGQSVTRETARL